jgi:hypothetical protein
MIPTARLRKRSVLLVFLALVAVGPAAAAKGSGRAALAVDVGSGWIVSARKAVCSEAISAALEACRASGMSACVPANMAMSDSFLRVDELSTCRGYSSDRFIAIACARLGSGKHYCGMGCSATAASAESEAETLCMSGDIYLTRPCQVIKRYTEQVR